MPAIRKLLLATILFFLLSPAACRHQFFIAEGAISSHGGVLGQWSGTPQGCTRDPFDGRQRDRSTSLATFLWEDGNARQIVHNRPAVDFGNVPLRLELSRAEERNAQNTPGDSSAITASLTTVKSPIPIRLDATVCRELSLVSREGRPVISGGRKTLRGRLKLDCTVQESRVTANIVFRGCEF